MPTLVIGTTLLAAVLHACWNALAKGAADKHLSMAGVIIGHLPYAIVGLFFVPVPDLASWPYLFGSLVLHFGYQIFLLNSYRIGDLTQVYPVARGIAPLIVAVISVTVLKVVLNWQEIAAIALIGAGLLSLGLVRTWRRAQSQGRNTGGNYGLFHCRIFTCRWLGGAGRGNGSGVLWMVGHL